MVAIHTFVVQMGLLAKLFLFHILVFVIPFFHTPLEGKGLWAESGDEIRVKIGPRVVPVRLYGIDAPGAHQKFGPESRRFADRRIRGKRVVVQPVFEDPYKRLIAWVSVDGRSLNREMLEEGLAWWYRKYVPLNLELQLLERSARRARKQLWSDPHPIPPWKFWASKKAKEMEYGNPKPAPN